MKKTASVFLAGALTLGLLAGCSGTSSQPAGSAAPSGDPAPASEPPS